jgi:hypothetical protein
MNRHTHISTTMKGLQTAHRALREGVATEPQVAMLKDRLQVAKTLANQGVMSGIRGHLAHAEQALQGIQARARSAAGWRPPELQYCELDALATFVDLHTHQVRNLGRQRAALRRATP